MSMLEHEEVRTEQRRQCRRILWGRVHAEARKSREDAVRGLQNLIESAFERGPIDATEGATEVVERILGVLNDTAASYAPSRQRVADSITLHESLTNKVDGTLLMLLSLSQSKNTQSHVALHFPKICEYVVPLLRCSDTKVREVVCQVIPGLARLDPKRFSSLGFLEHTHSILICMARSTRFTGEDRGLGLETVGKIAKEVGKDAFAPYLGGVLHFCDVHLSTNDSTGLPRKFVISCLQFVAQASHGSEEFQMYMRQGLLEKVFHQQFTMVLVYAICAIQAAYPEFAEGIELRLVQMIATILRRGIVRKSQVSATSSRSDSSEPNSFVNSSHDWEGNARGGTIDSSNSGNDDEADESVPIKPRDESYPQTGATRNVHRTEYAVGDYMFAASYSSSVDNFSYEGFESYLHTYMTKKAEAKLPESLDDAIRLDRANSPCVALKAIEYNTVMKMQVGDITLFASQFVLDYLDEKIVKVRLLAVCSCARLMEAAAQSWIEIQKVRGHAQGLRSDIQEILLKLVGHAVADPSMDVRQTALKMLDRDLFHPYLLQPSVLSNLFLCFYDECFEVRRLAVSLGGRLSRRNPAHVNIALRKLLEYILCILRTEHNALSETRRECTTLLQLFIHEARPLADFYSEAIMEALVSRLNFARRMNDKEVAKMVLLSIGDLGGISSRVNLIAYCDRIVPHMVSYILDDHVADRKFCKTAINALFKLVQCTGYVIKPYAKFTRLLPGLLQMLHNENDVSLRQDIETLMGCLGAVDPSDHKDAALPTLTGSSLGNAAPIGVRASRPTWIRTRTMNPASLPKSMDDPSFQTNIDSVVGSLLNRQSGLKGATVADSGFPGVVQAPAQLISLFSVGPERIAQLTSAYTPVWARVECEELSLVGLLEHPFTASPDYFPSIALDKVMSICRGANRKDMHVEAFKALVEILNDCTERITNFLHAIFPCMLWVLRPVSLSEEKPVMFSPLHKFVLARLAEIVTLSGKQVLPYVFDTVLLINRYFQDSRFNPECVVSCCKLLECMHEAIGEVFKPIICLLLSSLLEALCEDITRGGPMSEAVLGLFRRLGPMLDKYSAIVLQVVVQVAEKGKNFDVREKALSTLISLLHDMNIAEIAAVVLHPLLRIITSTDSSGWNEKRSDADHGLLRREFSSLPDGAALALTVVATKAKNVFKAFVPVAAKMMRSVPQESRDEHGKQLLLKMMLEVDRKYVSQALNLSEEDMICIMNFNSIMWSAPNDTQAYNLDASEYPEANGIGLEVIAEEIENPNNLAFPEEELLQLWRIQDNFTGSDWKRWRSDLEQGLIKCSGSPALRACTSLAENPKYQNLARPLFNAAFLSCWTPPRGGEGLSDKARREIVNILIRALQSPSMPINLTQAILNLFEFMEHDERPLPASIEFLAQVAFRCGAFAKALRYKEGEYSVITRSLCPRTAHGSLAGNVGLLSIYEKLSHDESAKGTAKHYEMLTGSTLNEHFDKTDGSVDDCNAKFEEWANKLGEWEDFTEPSKDGVREPKHVVTDEERAEAFRILKDEDVDSPRWSFLLKKLKNQNDLGNWRTTNRMVKQAWNACAGNDAGRRKLAIDGKGISVAFDLANWEEFEERIHYLTEDPFLNAFYRTLLLVRKGQEDPSLLDDAERYLQEARSHLDVHLTARLSEGYPRAYLEVINAQTLVELEEMIKCLREPKSNQDFAHYRLQAIWDNRLAGCKYDDYIWYRLLMIRSLVLKPFDAKDRWIEFSCLCRKNGRNPLASEALRMLVLPGLSEPDQKLFRETRVEQMPVRILRDIRDLDIRYAVCRHIWACGKEKEAFEILKESVPEYKEAADSWKSKEPLIGYLTSVDPQELVDRKEVMVASEVLLKLAKWSFRLVRRATPDSGATEEMALAFARSASEMRAKFYKPWHWWGQLNYEHALEAMGVSSKDASGQGNRSILNSEAKRYLTHAAEGFFKAIKIGGKTSLEDALKVLALWFRFGSVAHMYKTFDRGFEDTVITGWLDVVPQIIARLHTSNRDVQAGIEHLLTRIGNEHPQMVVYFLIVAKTTQGHKARNDAASRVLDAIKRKHSKIVSQAEMVARELVRVAVLWGELWYEKLEEASRLYFGEKDLDSMLGCVRPMHEMLNRGPETSYEKAFMELYGRELMQAGEIVREITELKKRKASTSDLDERASKLWEYYYYVFGRIQKQQHMMNALDLSKVSQWLKHANNLELAVPGNYDPKLDGFVTLQSFGPLLRILQSKQRPRKLSVLGSDGRRYFFLLKGHEDLRQDERVMQVFGLINRILSHGQERSIRRGVDIKRYSVVALSCNAGLIEWVPNCDTMHALVKEHREVRKVMPNIEHKVMTRVAPEPDRLPLLHKVDIFEFMLQNTSGSDIARVLWLKSRSSEVWLDRRTTYARSLASSSMAGYILGLGDRHPSNLMMDRASGKVMHIDFGDCFEVAMVRDKYPEKVPFRLTRMLVNALEPCGVEGYFRHTCEAVMRELREPNNRDALMSMMEAFVHDPLLRMKLVGGEELQRLRDENNRVSTLNAVLYNPQPPVLSESLQLRLLTQQGSLTAAHAFQSQQEMAQVNEPHVAGAIATGINPPNHAAMPTSPSKQSRRERDRLLKVIPADKCIEVADERAAIALQRVKDKLHGQDFGDGKKLSVPMQVEKLIKEATNVENLCSLFTGWCAFW